MDDGKQLRAQEPAKKPEAAAAPHAASRPEPSKAVQAAVERVKKSQSSAILLCDTKLTDTDIRDVLSPTVKSNDKNVCLRSLSLFGSSLTLTSTKILADTLASHENLTMLDLGQNQLGAQGVEAVCNALIHNSFLRTLGLARTDMGDQGATAMAHVMRINSCLTEVYLNNNNIQQEGACELAGALLFNDSARLSKLFLYGNHVGAEGVAEFEKLLVDCPTVDDRVPMDSEKALALAMGTHTRLGATSQVMLLHGEPLDRKCLEARSKKAADKRRSSSLLKVVRECAVYRSVKRGIYGLEA